MKQINLDLGTEGMDGCCPVAVSSPSEKQKYYPTFHYSGSEPLGIPESGKMVVEFREVNREHSKPSGGKERYSCTIEIREIVSVEAGDDESTPKNRMKASEDALDSLRSKKIKESAESGDY